MGIVRRFAAGLLVVLPVLTGTTAVAVAGAAAPSGEELPVSGSFTARGTLTSECTAFHQVVNGSGDWTSLGATSFTLDFCTAADTGGNHWPIYDGTFTLTAADGTITGDMSGFVEAGGTGLEFPLHFVLTATGGTGRFAGATGEIAMEGAFGPAAAFADGTVDGTVVLPPPTPTGIRDCLHGGWRDVVDDQGRPFRSAGDCVRWVIRHRR